MRALITLQKPANMLPNRFDFLRQLSSFFYEVLLSNDQDHQYKNYHDSKTIKHHSFTWAFQANTIQWLIASPIPRLLPDLLNNLQHPAPHWYFFPITGKMLDTPAPSHHSLNLISIAPIQLALRHQLIRMEDPRFLPALKNHLIHRLSTTSFDPHSVNVTGWESQHQWLQLKGSDPALQWIADSGIGRNTSSGFGTLASPNFASQWFTLQDAEKIS